MVIPFFGYITLAPRTCFKTLEVLVRSQIGDGLLKRTVP